MNEWITGQGGIIHHIIILSPISLLGSWAGITGFYWGGIAETSECVFEPPFLRKGFWTLLAFEAIHHPTSAISWHSKPKPSHPGVTLDLGCFHSPRTWSWVESSSPPWLGVPLFPLSFWGNDFSGKNRPRPQVLGSENWGENVSWASSLLPALYKYLILYSPPTTCDDPLASP